ncbi:AAA-type ATPase lid domain-containing protein [Peribacillus frigoritolerans]
MRNIIRINHLRWMLWILCAYHWPGNIRELSNISDDLY